ncbi:unnamed protein product [Allacma fusca]|uniref:BTB domain-containing protein n=1 Tax=Allacma fusca TaxID=39272 RepID=A0A8J2LBE8_9HEXA|nr:unnamed protein product [Allacma fusca]
MARGTEIKASASTSKFISTILSKRFLWLERNTFVKKDEFQLRNNVFGACKISGELGAKVGPMGEEIFAHKLVLSAASPVFETMFSSRWNSADKIQNIQLPDVEPLAFRIFLKFIYNQCKIKRQDLQVVPAENILDLIYIARKYDISELVDTALKILLNRLDIDNAITVYQQAQDFREIPVEKNAFEFIVRRLPEILETNQITLLRQENLCKLLSIDDLDIREVSLFQACCRWAAAECKRLSLDVSPTNYRKVLGGALDLIRFPTMKSEDLTFQVANCGILTSEEMVEILKFVSLPVDKRTGLNNLKYITRPRQGYQNDLRLLFCRRYGIFEHIYILHNSSWFQTCFTVNRKVKIKVVGLALTFHDATNPVFLSQQGSDEDRMDTEDILNNNSEEKVEVNIDISQTDNVQKAFATCGKVCRTQVRIGAPSLTYVGFNEPVEILPNIIHTISYMFIYKQADLSHHLTSLGDVELNVSPVEVKLSDSENVRFEFLVTKGNDHPYLECPIREIAFCL